MALEITDELKRKASGGVYISPARICVTADGEVCDERDTRAVRLLVGKGGELPLEEARQYGLVEEEKAAKPAGNKAAKGAANKAAEEEAE